MSFSILVVDDENNFRDGIKQYLVSMGFEVYDAANLGIARKILSDEKIDIVLLDVQIDREYGPDLLYDIARMRPTPKTIIITAYGEVQMAVDAMRNGAFDFLSKPINFDILQSTLKRAEEVITLNRELELYRTAQSKAFEYVVGKNPKIERVFKDAGRAAKAGVSVLINGETGVGKEIILKYIHQNGDRAKKQLVSINCAAIQPTVLESELFGHEAGAFTGAVVKRIGLFEVADGGILFLDEISSMGTDMQSKILRSLEEKKIRRVGGNKEISVDVQIIAASNKNLLQLIQEGKFREDLYFRLRVVDIDIPPLRERKEDIPELTAFFIKKINQERGLNIDGVSEKALQALMAYEWPGNIRELRNAIERACVFCVGRQIEICDLSINIAKGIS